MPGGEGLRHRSRRMGWEGRSRMSGCRAERDSMQSSVRGCRLRREATI